MLAVTAVSRAGLRAAIATAYAATAALDLNGASGASPAPAPRFFWRSDVGARALARPLRVGVLGSTRGTDLAALFAAADARDARLENVEFVLVISNKARKKRDTASARARSAPLPLALSPLAERFPLSLSRRTRRARSLSRRRVSRE